MTKEQSISKRRKELQEELYELEQDRKIPQAHNLRLLDMAIDIVRYEIELIK